jgi:hypothetical protein
MGTEIRFSVGSDVLSVPEISAVFGMEPDHGWSVGEVNSLTGRVFKDTYWALSESVHRNLASPRAGALMRRLREIELRYIDTIDRDWSGRICLIQRFEGSDSGKYEARFDRDWLDLMNRMHLDLECDQYEFVDDVEQDTSRATPHSSNVDLVVETVSRDGEVGSRFVRALDHGFGDDTDERVRTHLESLPTVGKNDERQVVYSQVAHRGGSSLTGLWITPATLREVARVGTELVIRTRII